MGDNGVVGTQKKILADVRELRRLVATLTTVLRTLKWVGLALGVLAATFKPEQLADLLRLIAGIAKLSG
jgi:hypothetical protein